VISTKHDRLVSAVIAVCVAGLLSFCMGCTTREQWMAGAASFRLEYGMTNGKLERGAKDLDNDSSYIAGSLQPLAHWDMKMRSELDAKAMIEQLYAQRPPPPPEEAGCAGKPK